MRNQPIPIILPTVTLKDGTSVKLSAAFTQNAAKFARDAAAKTARDLEDGDTISPSADVAAASRALDGFREAKAVLDGAKRLLEAHRVAVGILEGNGISYPASLAAEPVLATSLEIRAAADSLRSFDPEAAEADLGPLVSQLKEMQVTLALDVTTAEKRVSAAETEARRCVGAAYAATAGHSIAQKRFADAGLKDWLPRDWPKGITVLGAAQLVEDAVSQRRMSRHEKRNEKRHRQSQTLLALEASRQREAAIDAKNDAAAQAVAKIMQEGAE
ncbi:hypothetical protein RGQ15_10325 [Paracoccus sp. MBLB3053]|uniref:Uncharacterized protein n=1 Tax=Paracoccus aurantius TaxID=3073814 RepID=A0ABU2HTW2_9RHOB|nr:hypothetical protein [Paracoccus sp. MBLB3053]MDS9467960.1 hypothetical protein [Paracoccus sp. MBLB3053]